MMFHLPKSQNIARKKNAPIIGGESARADCSGSAPTSMNPNKEG